MSTTELIRPRRASTSPHAAASPTFGDVLAETVPLVGVIPVAGPPAVLLIGPWLLCGLMLAGPFALLLTIVALLVAAAAVVALIRAIIAAPYVLFQHLRAHRRGQLSMHAPAVQLVAAGTRWRAA